MTLLLLLVFIASFLGSLHCGLMCCHLQYLGGGLGQKKFWSYHFSRGIGYLSLALALRLGRNSLTYLNGLIDAEAILTLALVAVLVTLGLYMLLFGRKPHLPRVLHLRAPMPSQALGFLTALMPCGWLWVFLTMGVAQPGYLTNLSLILVFWLGTLFPFLLMRSLSQSPWLHRQNFSFLKFGPNLNRLLGVLILLTAGLQYTVKTGGLALPKVIHDLNLAGLELLQRYPENTLQPVTKGLLCEPATAANQKQTGH